MPKVKIKVILKNYDNDITYNIFGTLNKEKNTITYFEEDELKTKVIFDYNQNKLIRENNNLLMTYNFKDKSITPSTINIKELNQIINLEIITEKLEISDYNIEIKYKIEEDNFFYKIEVK